MIITQSPRQNWGSCANLMSVILLWESQIAIYIGQCWIERRFPPHPFLSPTSVTFHSYHLLGLPLVLCCAAICDDSFSSRLRNGIGIIVELFSFDYPVEFSNQLYRRWNFLPLYLSASQVCYSKSCIHLTGRSYSPEHSTGRLYDPCVMNLDNETADLHYPPQSSCV